MPASWTRGVTGFPGEDVGLFRTQGRRGHHGGVRAVIRWTVGLLVIVHGLIHLMGAVKGFGWADVDTLHEPLGPSLGVAWLAAAALVTAAGVMLLARARGWWAVAAGGAVCSQVVITTSWGDAAAGTAGNVLLALAALYGFRSHGPSSFRARFRDLAAATEQACDHEHVATPEAPAGVTPVEGLRPLGQALGTYLVLEADDAIVLVDQHALHERVLFDRINTRLREKGGLEVQRLLVPKVVHPGPAGAARLLDERHVGRLVGPYGRRHRDDEGIGRLRRGEGLEPSANDGGMHQPVETVPLLAELLEEAGDLRVVLHVERVDQAAAEVGGELGDAVLEAVVLIGEGELGAFAVHGLGDAVGNRTVAEQTGDEDSFAGEKAHER